MWCDIHSGCPQSIGLRVYSASWLRIFSWITRSETCTWGPPLGYENATKISFLSAFTCNFFFFPEACKVQKWGSCLMNCMVDICKCCLKLCECIGQGIKTCLSIECVHYILSVHFMLCVHLQLTCLGGCCCQVQLSGSGQDSHGQPITAQHPQN